MSQCVILIHNSQSCAASSSLMTHITLSQQSHTVILHNLICSYSGGVELGTSLRTKCTTKPANEQTCPRVITPFSSASLPLNHHRCPDNLAEAAKLTASGTYCISRQPAVTSPEKCSCTKHSEQTTAHKTNRNRRSKNKTDGHGDGETPVRVVQRCSLQAEMQLFFLPAEETWHSVPSKAGYRTLLSLQPLQTPLTIYHQHSKEKSGEKSHRFDRCCS